MTDFRTLCAELVELDQAEPGDYVELDQAEPGDYANWRQSWNAAVDRARAALAQPEPQGPTDEELNDTYWKAWHEHLDRTNSVLHAAGLRAVLARWGRPTITPIPVNERLPNPEDCDAEKQCWWFYFKSESQWNQWVYSRGNEIASYWLPYHALPLPQRRCRNRR